MRRGDVYNVRLDSVEGYEQGGSRPVIVVSRNSINNSSPTVLAVPCTTYRPGKRVYVTWLTDKSLISPNKSGSLKLNSVSSFLML